jgi:hypothetical protein
VNKKKQKNFIDAGPWALALTMAMAQHRQKFLRPLSAIKRTFVPSLEILYE